MMAIATRPDARRAHAKLGSDTFGGYRPHFSIPTAKSNSVKWRLYNCSKVCSACTFHDAR